MNKKYTRNRRRKDKYPPMSAQFDNEFGYPLPLPLHLPHHFHGLGMPLSMPFPLMENIMREDKNQPPITQKLDHLLQSVSSKHKYYVYDVYYYETEKERYKTLGDKTLNTLRIGVLSPLLIGIPQQNRQILEWAVHRELLPANWEKTEYSQSHVSDSQRTTADIADTFIQYLLRTETQNLVKISYHIGEWYNFSRKDESHDMNQSYRLDSLKRDLQEMLLLQSIWCIYTDVPKELVWYIAVFVCHQYFFYLANSEYKSHTLLRDIEYGLEDEGVLELKDEGNDLHKAKSYLEAIQKYTEAIKICPYSHLLYSNRAISYLKLRESMISSADKQDMAKKYALSAMSDAFRCIKLDPLYAKGHCRYASALDALDERVQAMKALENAIKSMEQRKVDKQTIKDLKLQLERLSGARKPTKRKAECDDSDNTCIDTKVVENTERNDSAVVVKDNSAYVRHAQKTFAEELKAYAKDMKEIKVIDKPSGSSNSEIEVIFLESRCAPRVSMSISEAKPIEPLSAEPKAIEPKSSGTKSAKTKTSETKSSATISTKEKETKDLTTGNPSSEGTSTSSKSTKSSQKTHPKNANRKTKDETPTVITDLAELEITISSGSEALLQQKYRFAINLYDKCFRLIHESTEVEVKAKMTGNDLLLLRYARCVAFIYAGPNEDIVSGIKELKLVLESQPSQTLQAITLYELGSAYAKQHRYEEAAPPVRQSLTICDSKKGLRDVYCWPGTQTFIEHSDQSVLKAKLTCLLHECDNPPQADFICLSDLCVSYGHLSSSIYTDDPDFRGYVSVLCTDKCVLHYHRECWKRKHLKVDSKCVTPDCDGLILRFTEYDEQLQKVLEQKSNAKYSKQQKEKKKVLKIPASSLVRIAEKQEKKAEKKAKKAERNKPAAEVDEEVDLADKILSGADKAVVEEPAANLRTSNFVIKNKKLEEVDRPAFRKGGKKTKSKQAMSLEEFCGPPAVEDTTSNLSSGSIPLPPQLREDMAWGPKECHIGKLPVVIQGVSVEKLKETVLEFYYDMLEADGPKRADSAELLSFLEFEQAAKELIQHCNGLTNFLLSTNRFVLIEGIICIKRDADIQKAQEMVDSLKNVPYGVGVVQSDFKEQVKAASSFNPRRKLYSGYDEEDQGYHTPSRSSTEHWQSVVQDWNQSEVPSVDEISVEGRERSGSSSTSVSEQEVAKTEKPPIVVEPEKPPIGVEPISPALKQDWKNYQDQKLMASLTCRTETEAIPPNSNPAPIANSDRLAFPQPTPPEPWTVSANADAADQLAFENSTASVDSLTADCNTNSVTSDLAIKDHSDVAARIFRHAGSPRVTLPSNAGLPELSGSVPYVPPTQYRSNMYVPQVVPMSMAPIAPIGTPYSYVKPFEVPSMPGGSLQNDYTRAFNPRMSWNSAAPGHIQPEVNNAWPKNDSLCAETQTEIFTCDNSSNTEYYYMDDYDKKVEECLGLQRRNEELSDNLQRLKQSNLTTIQDLQRKLDDALIAERETRAKSQKAQQQVEKDARKWKEEKKSWTDEMNSMKKMTNESRWRSEQAESKYKQLEETSNAQQRSSSQELEEKDSVIRQYQARLEHMERQWIEAQVEVINERERYALSQLEELLATTNKSIDQQREQVQRLLQTGNGVLPPIVRKNAELSNQRRERLLAIKREQESLYESQREAIKYGTIPWTKIPRTSPPSLMEIITSTSLPRPPIMPLRPPMNIPMNHQMMQKMRPPMMQAPLAEQPSAGGAYGDGLLNRNHPAPGRQSPAPDNSQRPPAKGQVTKKNVENQLIQDIQSIFPVLSGEDIKGYISKLRETRQGLTGMTFAELKRHTVELIMQSNGQRGRGSAAIEEECAICSEGLNTAPIRKLRCGHLFHDLCIGDWLTRQRNCPVCRQATA